MDLFADATIDSVGYDSCWQKHRAVKESSAQTSQIITNEKQSQTVVRSEIEVQTEEKGDGDDWRVAASQNDSQELLDFLIRVEPEVSFQLEKNLHSRAFDGYDVVWSDQLTSVSCLHTLNHLPADELECTDLSWNSTGSVVGVAYGRFDRETSSSHKSFVCTWNVDRRVVNSTKADVSIELNTSPMSIAFHPHLPSVIAGGTLSGEVIVWDTSREEEPVVASSGIGDESHKEPVLQIKWIPDPYTKGEPDKPKYYLVSAGSDGRILVWDIVPRTSKLKLVDSYVLLTQSVPRRLRISKARGDTPMGATALAFSHENRSLFVAGTEGGGVFKCSLEENPQDDSTLPRSSPITFSFTPHHGPVYSASCSPFHRNLLLTSGTDATIRLYNMLQSKPILTVEPGPGYVFKTQWSPVRPLVFGAATSDGHVLVCDLKASRIAPVVTLDHGKPVYAMEFNNKRLNVLASGDGNGTVKVWQLSDQLTTQGPREIRELDELAQSTLD